MSAWFTLLAAGLLEIAWAVGLKYSDGLTRFWPTAGTVVAIAQRQSGKHLLAVSISAVDP